MTVILDLTTPRSLDTLLERLLALKPTGLVEAWLFEDEPARKNAEQRLAAAGIAARLRSTYKPLVHFFLEEVGPRDLSAVTVHYPVLANASPKRFILEAYPLAAMLGDATLSFVAEPSNSPLYRVELTDKAGITSQHKIFAPNRVHADHVGETQLSPTGWLRIASAGIDEAISTDFETLYARIIEAVEGYDFGRSEPYFDELNIRVALPGRDRRFGVGDEAISLHEAMHEDLYFSLLEIFQKRSGNHRSAINARPGHIVPQVSHVEGDPSARVETRPLYTAETSQPRQALGTATHPIAVDQIRAELASLGGTLYEAQSRSGRAVMGAHKPGSDAGVIISGGQHANETTGIIGALRAAHVLAARKTANFAIAPLENPDGYALHHRLRAEHPGHMHHAARYTGLGDDVESRGDKPIFESVVRREGQARVNADLHLNLHGYPAHEWTRPLSGYLPQGFEMWTLPKGFFLVMRHHADWAETAEKLVIATTERLAEIPGLVAYNRRQIETYEAHAGPASTFRVINGFPCLLTSEFKYDIPLTLITEFPDETIYGDEFILGHTAQMQTVLAAYDAYQGLVGAERPAVRA